METRTNAQVLDEKNFGEVDVVLMYIEEARARTERARKALRANGAEDYLVDAMERTQAQLSETAKVLTQKTFFAVPHEQMTLT